MSLKWTLLKSIQREPDNALHCFAMADLLEEEGWPELSFAYRWMGWYGRRPGYREGKRLRKRYVWYKEEAFGAWPSDEADRYHNLPKARLDPLVFAAMEIPNRGGAVGIGQKVGQNVGQKTGHPLPDHLFATNPRPL
jgi:hypothetical protein